MTFLPCKLLFVGRVLVLKHHKKFLTFAKIFRDQMDFEMPLVLDSDTSLVLPFFKLRVALYTLLTEKAPSFEIPQLSLSGLPL